MELTAVDLEFSSFDLEAAIRLILLRRSFGWLSHDQPALPKRPTRVQRQDEDIRNRLGGLITIARELEDKSRLRLKIDGRMHPHVSVFNFGNFTLKEQDNYCARGHRFILCETTQDGRSWKAASQARYDIMFISRAGSEAEELWQPAFMSNDNHPRALVWLSKNDGSASIGWRRIIETSFPGASNIQFEDF